MSGTWEHAGIAVSTVGKVLLVAASGLAISKKLKFKTSVKGVSYITVYIFLPCLLFTRIVRGITMDSFSRLYWAMLLALLPILIGLLFARLVSALIPRELRGLLQVGCAFQNAVSFPLAIIISLHSVPWLAEGADKDQAQVYVFVYNITSSILLWSLGSHIVRTSKAEEDALNAQQKEKEEPRDSSPPSTAAPQAPPQSSLPKGSWVTTVLKPMMSAPLVASFVGLLVALTPLRALFLTRGMETLLGGMETLGAGTVPLTLFVLGCNLVSDDTSGSELPKRFVVAMCFVRLVLIPSAIFAAVHALSAAGAIPDSRIFKLVMLVEGMAPSAINSSVICSLYSYRTKEYTRTLFFEYIAAIASTSFWLTLFLWYLA